MKYLHEAVARGPRVVSGCRGARIRVRSSASMLDAIIPALKHRIPSELRSLACLGESSTSMDDFLRSPRVAFPFFQF